MNKYVYDYNNLYVENMERIYLNLYSKKYNIEGEIIVNKMPLKGKCFNLLNFLLCFKRNKKIYKQLYYKDEEEYFDVTAWKKIKNKCI
jgi:hypothetical protein